MSRPTEISADDQGMMELFDALEEIRTNGVAMSGRACAELAEKAIAASFRIRQEANPIPLQDISEAEHGDTVNQPHNVLYTLTVTEEGDANAWTSHKVQSSEQIAWLHGMVSDCAAALAKDASGPAGLN